MAKFPYTSPQHPNIAQWKLTQGKETKMQQDAKNLKMA